MSVWKSDETLLSICILNFSFKNDFVWEEISNIRHSVSSPDETPRSSSKILRCASYFQLSSRCFIWWWNTASHVWYITSRIQQRKCSHVEAIFASISSELGIIKRLERRLNQPMKLDRFSFLQRFSLPSPVKRWFHWSNAVTWCVTWKIIKVEKKKSGQMTSTRGNGTVCLHSNMIRIAKNKTKR